MLDDLSTDANPLSPQESENSPPPLLSGDNVWSDVTTEFMHLARDLPAEHLVQDFSLTLNDAILAIEFMEVRLDSGVGGALPTVLNFEQGLQNGLIVDCNLTDAQIVDIVDSTLLSIVSWMNGNHSMNSIFNNLYMHRPNAMQNEMVACFLCLARRMCMKIANTILVAGAFDDADQNQSSFTMVVSKKTFPMTALPYESLIFNLEEHITKYFKRFNSNSSKTKNMSHAEIALYKSVIMRLTCFCTLARVFLVLLPDDDSRSFPIVPTQRVMDAVRSIIRRCADTVRSTYEEAVNLFNTMQSYQFFAPGINMSKVRNYGSTNDQLTLYEAVRFLVYLCEDLFAASSLLFSGHDLYLTMREILKIVGVHNAEPCLFARSCMQLIYAPMGVRSVPEDRWKKFVIASLVRFCEPPFLQLKNMQSHQAYSAFQQLLEMCCSTLPNMLHSFSLTSGHRLHYADTLLPLLGKLCRQATVVDHLALSGEMLSLFLTDEQTKLKLPVGHFSVFFHAILLENIREYIFLGFVSDVYGKHELPLIYWYMMNMLFPASVRYMIMMRSCPPKEPIMNSPSLMVSRIKRLGVITTDLVMLMSFEHLSRAYYWLLMGMHCLRLTILDEKLHMTAKISLSRRLEVMNTLPAPFMIQVEQYLHETLPRLNDHSQGNEYLANARDCFRDAKEWLRKDFMKGSTVNRTLEISKRNFVSLGLVLQGAVEITGLQYGEGLAAIFPFISTVRKSSTDDKPPSLQTTADDKEEEASDIKTKAAEEDGHCEKQVLQMQAAVPPNAAELAEEEDVVHQEDGGGETEEDSQNSSQNAKKDKASRRRKK